MTLSYPIRSETGGIIGQMRDWRYSNSPFRYNIGGLTSSESGENFSLSHRRSKDGSYRSGGPWLMYQRRVEHSSPALDVYRYYHWIAYSGHFMIRDDRVAELGVNNMQDESYDSLYTDAYNYGAQAWAKLKPDTPDFSAVLALAELRELVPPLKQRAQSAFLNWLGYAKKRKLNPRRWDKKIADKYIEYNFGWLPLMNDIVGYTAAFQGRKNRFDQLLRDERKPVRRRAHLKVDIDDDYQAPYSEVIGSGGANPYLKPVLVSQCYRNTSGTTHSTVKQHRHRTRVWCEGSSRYILPPGPRDDAWKRKIYRRIMGRNISPYQVYNMIPWSWMVDYFSGLGDFMEAASTGIAERQWFEYAYVMKHTIKEHRTRCRTHVYVGYSARRNVNADVVVRDTSKVRVPASPFGWGLDSPNSKQMSMLGALGYSRLP